MKGRSRTNRRFSSVYNATPSAPVSAMTIAGLTPAAPYSPGSARISAYQMTPSPRRLAIWKIRRGRPREAPRFSLRHRPYSAASIRAMNVPRPMTGTASVKRASIKLRNREGFVAPTGFGHGFRRAGRASPPQGAAPSPGHARNTDRKSTRLNSSHDQISYAVFCLKKKKKKNKMSEKKQKTHK